MLAGEWLSFVDLTDPGYLAVLAVLPLVVVLSVRSLAGLGPVRRAIAIGLRCLVIAVMVMALAGPQWVRTVDDQTIVFALDESDSVPDTRQRECLAFMQHAAAGMRPDKDDVAVLSFADRASVEQVAHAELVADRIGGAAGPHRTNIAGALRLGMALFPGDTAKRLVLLSDGNENSGVATQEADAYAALGIPIDVVPLRYEHAAEILVDQLSAPATAECDEVVNLQLVVRTQVATTARLTLYRGERLVDLDPATSGAGLPIQLSEGPNRFSIPVELHAPGVHRFRAVIQPDDPAVDAITTNNEGQAFTIVGQAARVAVVTDSVAVGLEPTSRSAEILAAALRDGGIECDLMSVDELPSDPAGLTDCSALILSNVSAFSLGQVRQQMLASYVRDQGGGLIVIGGDQAFSVGGYAHTPLEEILPVETSRAKLKLLSLSMVIVIDRSGSMAGEKIAMAREAAIGAVKLLSRLDRIGVVAFTGATEWLVPLQPADNRNAIVRRLSTLGGGGGTDMYPALEQAQTALAGASTNLRHIIVLTDGQSVPGDFEGLARACGRAGITISAIAVGPDADRALLARIAQLSGGRMYVAESARPLPQIFARETVLASRSGLFERPFTPQLRRTANERILTGFAASDIPRLRGHVVTAAKPMAQVPLVRTTEEGADPILAYWQVGLGRAVAFTSGLWPRWGPEWVAWPGFGKLWTQAARYAARSGTSGDLEIETTIKGSEGHVRVSAEHLPLRVQGSLMLSGQVIGPDYAVAPLRLQREAAGCFEATFPVDLPGTYLLHMPYSYGAGEEDQSGVLRAGVVQSYSPEYRTLRHNESTLAELARRTGGRVLDLNHPDAVFEHQNIRPVQVRRPFWENLIRLALVLFLIDVAVRRIAVTPAEVVERIRRLIRELAGSRAGAGSAATLGALRGVKARTQADGRQVSAAPAETRPRPAEANLLEPDDSDPLARALNTNELDKPVVAKSQTRQRPPASSERDYTARLLRAKRRARGGDDQGETQ